jgi:hypothetical protein
MGRVFNIAGPCIESKHYMLPPADRVSSVHSLLRVGALATGDSIRRAGGTGIDSSRSYPRGIS